MNDFAKALLNWYKTEHRKLPWREHPSPYWIYLSEVMLQQTRMESALPYFAAFTEALPTLEDLAAVPEERLLKLWEGLGYYSRARNLKKGAQYICEQLGGVVPSDPKELEKIPGIGPYSAGAIASTLYQVKAAAVDGNVLRVFSRIFRIEDELQSAALKKQVREKVLSLIPEESPGDFNQALMELGARVCKPSSPDCARCPLASFCLSAGKDDAASFPRKKVKTPPKEEAFTVFLLEAGERIALRKEKSALLKGLYAFPSEPGFLTEEAARAWLEGQGVSVSSIELLGTSAHLFSHRKWVMRFFRVLADEPSKHFSWHEKKRLGEIPIASAFRYLKEYLGL